VQASPSSDILNARRQTLPSITQGQYGQGQSVHTSSLAPATPNHSSNYPSHMNGTYGLNNHNMSPAVSSRDSSRPSTANSLPPSRFPAQVMDNGHFHLAWSRCKGCILRTLGCRCFPSRHYSRVRALSDAVDSFGCR